MAATTPAPTIRVRMAHNLLRMRPFHRPTHRRDLLLILPKPLAMDSKPSTHRSFPTGRALETRPLYRIISIYTFLPSTRLKPRPRPRVLADLIPPELIPIID